MLSLAIFCLFKVAITISVVGIPLSTIVKLGYSDCIVFLINLKCVHPSIKVSTPFIFSKCLIIDFFSSLLSKSPASTLVTKSLHPSDFTITPDKNCS